MSQIKLLLGVYCHQPVGVTETAIGRAFRRHYLPFFQLMENHPGIKFSFYLGGVLSDWLLKNHPEFFDSIRKMISRHQAEVLSGAYYDPILALIPDQDKTDQIEFQNSFIKNHFRSVPRGAWLAEGVWEPHLPRVLSAAGIEYVSIDDVHFISSGIPNDNLSGYYVTEDQGKQINVFPNSTLFQQYVQAQKLDQAFSYFEQMRNAKKDGTIVFWERAENFSLWPSNAVVVYAGGIFDRFLGLLDENSSWVKTMTFSEYCDEFPSRGRVYLTGSSFRNNLVRYPEANNLHKKMLYVSAKIDAIRKTPDPMVEEARRELHQGQSHSPYWHGLAGGIHFNHLRSAAYEHLIRAEALSRKVSSGGEPYTGIVVTDFDKDGHEEVLMSNDQLGVYFSPCRGGSIFELDFKPRAYNLLNTFCQNSTLLDHFFEPAVSLHQLRSREFKELGDFLQGEYDFFPLRKKEEVVVTFSKTGFVTDKLGSAIPVKILKKAALLAGQSIVNIEYEISNLGSEEAILWFGSEFNLAFSSASGENQRYEIKDKPLRDPQLNSVGIIYKLNQIRLVDGNKSFSVSLLFEKDCMLIRFPIETVFQAADGWRKDYQGSVVLPIWQIHLSPKQNWTNKISLKFEI